MPRASQRNAMHKNDILLDSIVESARTAFYRSLLKKFKDAGHDITVEQWSLIQHLWQKEGLTQQEISGCSKKDNPSVCRLIDNMEKRNLVVRVPDQNDRRTNRIYLTNKGKDLQKTLVDIAKNNLKNSVKDIDSADLKVCKSVLEKMIANLEMPEAN